MEFILLPLFGFFVFLFLTVFIVIKRQKTASEQQNRQQTHDQEFRQAQTAAPASPAVSKKRPQASANPQRSVQTPNVKSAASSPSVNPPSKTAPEQKTVLTFSGDEAVKGILYAEILGKPKALR